MDHHGNKESSFYHCLKTDNSDQASILLSSGFSVNSILSDGKTPLTIAVERENFKMVELLLLHGADVNTACYSNLYCTFETALVAAARVQNLQILDLLLQYGEMKDETESRVGGYILSHSVSIIYIYYPNLVILPVDNNEHQRIDDVSTDRIFYDIRSEETMGLAL